MQAWDTIPLVQRKAFLSACSSENLTSVEILTDTSAKFTITLGNTIDKASVMNSLAESLRHALLTQVQGYAMTHLALKLKTFREEKAASEIVLYRYARLEGIVETVREIISNFRKVIFRLDNLPNYVGEYLFKHGNA